MGVLEGWILKLLDICLRAPAMEHSRIFVHTSWPNLTMPSWVSNKRWQLVCRNSSEVFWVLFHCVLGGGGVDKPSSFWSSQHSWPAGWVGFDSCSAVPACFVIISNIINRLKKCWKWLFSIYTEAWAHALCSKHSRQIPPANSGSLSDLHNIWTVARKNYTFIITFCLNLDMLNLISRTKK